MAWTELKESQKIEQRWDGGAMWRHFIANWTDINATNLSFDRYYWIGQSLQEDLETVWPASAFLKSLRICNIVITPHPQAPNKILIDLEYSTKQDKTTYEAFPNCVESHDIAMDVSTNTYSVDDQYLDVDRNYQSWLSKYLAANSAIGSALQNIPSLTLFKPQTDVIVSAYYDQFLPKRVLQKTGQINSGRFMGPYLAAIASATGIEVENLSDFDDTEAWLLVGANVRKARTDSWQYQYVMKWSEWGAKNSEQNGGWNNPYGIWIDAYNSFDFMDLFDGMWELAIPGIIHGNR